jgi:carotenoid cleavage dioxygenase-like enzyme
MGDMSMTTIDRSTVPFHLAGNYRPVADELTALDLPVRGELPAELCGSFLRNGPNPLTPSAHWFLGEGMIHALRVEDGERGGTATGGCARRASPAE